MHAALRRADVDFGRDQTARLMRELRLAGARRGRGKRTTVADETAPRPADLVGRQFTASRPNPGTVEALRLLKIVRDTAVKARSAAMIAPKATLVTAEDRLRAELEPLTDYQLIEGCAALDSVASVTDPAVAMRHVLGSLARRWLQLHDEIKIHSRHLKNPDEGRCSPAGRGRRHRLGHRRGDAHHRRGQHRPVRSDAAFAKMCGACPIPAPAP